MITITVPNDDLCMSTEDCLILPNTILPDRPGIYRFYGEDNEILYIGKAKKLRQRLRHHIECAWVSNTEDVAHNFCFVRCFFVDDPMELDIYETYLINTLKPPLNREKTFTYKHDRYNLKYQAEEALEEKKQIARELREVIRAR